MTEKTTEFQSRSRWLVLIVIAVVILALAIGYAVSAFARYQARTTGQSEAEIAVLGDGPKIVFRNTASGQGYGHVASVAFEDPSGPRELGDVACDRVDVNAGLLSCMQVVRGIPPSYRTSMLDLDFRPQAEWPLPGVPSRTRISDSGLVATTAFVTGHSYATNTFSTETTVKSVGGLDYGNLEDFSIYIDGQELTAVDRNVWGVSFEKNDEFYATVASGSKTWLVHGDLQKKVMTSVLENAECTSISPDGTRVAYKKRRAGEGPVHWDAAFLDLATHQETVISLETSFDDQLEWLNDETLVFGMPRVDSVGDSDVYSLRAAKDATPQVLIEHAWSPSVERNGIY